jgi:hypothetical protein
MQLYGVRVGRWYHHAGLDRVICAWVCYCATRESAGGVTDVCIGWLNR